MATLLNSHHTEAQHHASFRESCKQEDCMNTSKTKTLNDDKVLAVGKERVNLQTASSKLIADIQFLKERIEKMRTFKNPNKDTLKTYEDMLKSREAVLAWLQQQRPGNADGPPASEAG